MQVRVLYFGVLKELLKRDGERVELPAQASVGTLMEAVRGGCVECGEVWRSLAVAVNQEYADLDWALQEGDEVALLPPVSGGAGLRMGRAR
jgi:molybdopterin converting factor subunit 1